MQVPPTPELDKSLLHKQDAQVIGEFLEWLNSRYILATFQECNECPCGEDVKVEILVSAHKPINTLLAQYFNLDEHKMEQERQSLLDSLSS